MKFKLLVLVAACLVICVPPAHSNLKMVSSSINTAKGIASIVPQMVKAKTSAVTKAAADMASIVAMGAGLEVNALGRASSLIKHAIADGFYAFGEALTKGANTITGDYPNYNEPNPTLRGRHPSTERCGAGSCNKEVVQHKFSAPKYLRYRPTELQMLRKAVGRRYKQGKFLTRGRFLNDGKFLNRGRFLNNGKFLNTRHGFARRPPFTYEIVYTPRFYRGPMGTFYIQKK